MTFIAEKKERMGEKVFNLADTIMLVKSTFSFPNQLGFE